MPEVVLTSERILETAEGILRRYGPAKATVSDVARALGVSHGSIYRHFASKSELRDAIMQRWLAQVAEPLAAISRESGPAPERLHRWLTTLIEAKRRRAFDDPEFFATYLQLVAEVREVVRAHIEALVAQITAIIVDGCRRGEFAPVWQSAPASAARAVFQATTRFHNPFYAAEWQSPAIDLEFENLWQLLAAGLRAESSSN